MNVAGGSGAPRDPAVVDHALGTAVVGRPLRVDFRLVEGGLRVELLREVPLKRVEVGQVELRCNPDSQAAPPGWTPDALRTATMAHGSTETNAMRADCIAATPTVKLLRRDGRQTRQTPCAQLPWLTGARKRTQCGRTVSQQARQGWYGRRRCSPGETFSCSQRKASAARRSLRSLPASFVKDRKVRRS